MILDVGARNHIGRRRPNNEDALFVDLKRNLYIVADGLGGHQAGEVASQLVIQEICKFVEGHLSDTPSLDVLRKAIEGANGVIYDRSLQDPLLTGMGTTVVAAMIGSQRLLLAHVGDSRAYLLTDHQLQRLTEDHTMTHRMIKNGTITEQEALVHPYRGILNRAVGVERVLVVDTQELEFHQGVLLICTDGLTDMLEDPEIEEVLLSTSHPQKACDRMVAMANEKGGKDNISVIVIKGSDQPE